MIVPRRQLLPWCWVVLGGLLILLTRLPATRRRPVESCVVHLSVGELQGTREDGVCLYRGVRYAKSPTGSRRWAPPVAEPPWNGRRLAAAMGPACLQTPPFGALPNTAEDCLSVNVFVDNEAGPRLPVVFFLHGGYGVRGGSSDSRWDALGTVRATRGAFIVVSANFRLNIMGWAVHPSLPQLDAQPTLLDQRLALQWVQTHIAAFGGDPSRVTLAGWSNGADCVFAHLLLPASWPLFAQAIALSAPGQAGPAFWSQSAAEVALSYERVAKLVGCLRPPRALNATCMLAAPAEALVHHAMHDVLGFYGLDLTPRLGASPHKVFAAGGGAPKPLLLGHNVDEYVTPPPPCAADCDRSAVQAWLESAHALPPAQAGQALDLYAPYAVAREGLPGWFWAARRALADAYFHCPLVRIAARSRSPAWYVVVDAQPEGEPPSLGVVHGKGATGVLFPTTSGLSDSAERQIMRRLVAFARTADPNPRPAAGGGGGRLAQWPRFGRNESLLLHIGAGGERVLGESAEQRATCAFWAEQVAAGREPGRRELYAAFEAIRLRAVNTPEIVNAESPAWPPFLQTFARLWNEAELRTEMIAKTH